MNILGAKHARIVTATMLTAGLLAASGCELDDEGGKDFGSVPLPTYPGNPADASAAVGDSSFGYWPPPFVDATVIPLPPSECSNPPCFDVKIGGGGSCAEHLVIDRFAHQACADRGARLESIGYDVPCGGGRVSAASARCCAPSPNWNPSFYDGGACEEQTISAAGCESLDESWRHAQSACGAKGLFVESIGRNDCRNGRTTVDITCCPASPYPSPAPDAGPWIKGDASLGDASDLFADGSVLDAGSDDASWGCSVHAFGSSTAGCANLNDVNAYAASVCSAAGRQVGSFSFLSTPVCPGSVQSASFTCCSH